ncbi:peptidase M4 [Caballeronia sp. EK]|uniref:peptidase M4 n=1 Tax=Caballeronia sp. EK TaxID=2767469 RepID=UPI001654F971|nr:peptidase M4 [Caballeronia sp. EK]MBC8635697.1 peptidase M4 [Caballeronia sp. EK]
MKRENISSPAAGPATPEAVAARAQSRDSAQPMRAVNRRAPLDEGRRDGYGTRYGVGANVMRTQPVPPLRKPQEPLYRPLRIYALDPAASRLEGALAELNVPYERLEPGPVGRLLRVEDIDDTRGVRYRRLDLDDHNVLLRRGVDPSPADPRFHQQMVYAVCSNVHAAFCAALGRQVSWGFKRTEGADQLIIRPHAFESDNAWYDEVNGELCFGYYAARNGPSTDRTLPGGYVFTCLSHDIVAHEMTHALLDGLRSSLAVPSGPDVGAFHEGFADLIALFQHFSYPEVVLAAIRANGADIGKAQLLTDLARQFGHSLGHKQALRSAIDADPPRQYDRRLEAHELGSVLVAAVFEAFETVYRRKIAPYLRLATHGTGILPPGNVPAELAQMLAEQASRLASQFLNVLIRAIDYCPPVDLSFGEFLRAAVTADFDLVPDDKWGYREALIDAFLRRDIYPRNVSSLSEDALLWRPPTVTRACIRELDFAHLRFRGDPAQPAEAAELVRQAHVLGEFVSRPAHRADFGIIPPGTSDVSGRRMHATPVQVESIRTARRIGPNGQVIFDLVSEVIQTCEVEPGARGPGFTIYGGCTVILGPDGDVRYAISKSVLGDGRMQRRADYMASSQGEAYWSIAGDRYKQTHPLFLALHGHDAETTPARPPKGR